MGYIAIVDYGVGNLMSVANALHYLGCESKIVADAKGLELASGIILPGVGAFPDAMKKLCEPGLDQELKVQAEKKPILGICLGMQMLFQQSEEIRTTAGLGFVKGTVKQIQTDKKLPHIGWNKLEITNDSPLLRGLGEDSYVYFVHTFCGMAEDHEQVLAVTDYGPKVVAAVRNENVYGTQFHPEKSGEVGLQILRNFADLNR